VYPKDRMKGRNIVKVKKVVLAAINAKYIHSNLAVYSLKANAGVYSPHVHICEYTINHRREEILAGLYKEKPDLIGFSCYLWNIEYVISIARDLKKICPQIHLVAGGPEVSYRPETFLEECDFFDLVMAGEGERTFAELLEYYIDGSRELAEIDGIIYRDEGKILRTKPRAAIDMDELVFPYGSLEGMENRILYYESIRGCPFSCSYCLSSIEKCVRMKSLEKTLQEIDFFLKEEVSQVKFVDRTFNCSHEHAYSVWCYLKEHDNGKTNFHFEIAGDLLREEDFELLSGLRPGQVQFEIGVQSTNPDTIRAIRRVMNLEKLRYNIKKLHEGRNIHAHLDLIAGLPYEDYDSFRHSFNDVYAMKPDQFQLGFLKVLDGSYMNEKKDDYGIVYSSMPPYEVYKTNWLSYDDVRELKLVEEMLEVYYNSFQFVATMAYLERFFQDAFEMYYQMGDYYRKHALLERKHNRISRYKILMDYAAGLPGTDREILRETLTFDLYSRDYVKNPPDFVKEHTETEKEKIRKYLQYASANGGLPEEYRGLSVKQLYHMLYAGIFSLDIEALIDTGEILQKEPYLILFDYRHRNPLDNSAGRLPVAFENVL
jgi:radical SAM superfamily enzyme YgiQ (UPF0313 family)